MKNDRGTVLLPRILTCILCAAGLVPAAGPVLADSDELVITEIMYNSPGTDDVEWFELYNRSGAAVDLTGWYVLDDNDENDHVALVGTLGAGEVLVVVQEHEEFALQYPDVTNVNVNDYWESFGLNNDNDAVRVFKPTDEIVDQVWYDDVLPWPPEADGDGPSLQLTDIALDNNVPASWTAGAEWGTPGVVEDDMPVGMSNWGTIKTRYR